MSLTQWWKACNIKCHYIIGEVHKFFCRRCIIILFSVRLDSKGTVGTIIKCYFSCTDGVYNGNRRPLNSRHTEVCHLRCYIYMCHGTHDTYNALPPTVPAVLADSLHHVFLHRDGRDLVHIQQYIPESVQSCDASK